MTLSRQVPVAGLQELQAAPAGPGGAKQHCSCCKGHSTCSGDNCKCGGLFGCRCRSWSSARSMEKSDSLDKEDLALMEKVESALLEKAEFPQETTIETTTVEEI
ncbi:unnamed protein product [Owenia fusiformis]|uniref:Uncharacterized protein n=1 Tax=Owenia fusiformis TaxID=6347 RepID=A0A8S4NIU9_OWEFU|nr:unnamed protein product [Owenia fusiformis]